MNPTHHHPIIPGTDSATRLGAVEPAAPAYDRAACVPAVVVMGVSGCGKSSVAEALADALGWALYEGDAYHAPASIAKMRAGSPLTDADRAGWLDTLSALLAAPAAQDGSIGRVLTCSALRLRYRDRLRDACPGIHFLFLQLGYDAALARVQARPGHFFSPALVADQFATLEEPTGEPDVLALDATASLQAVAAQAAAWLRAGPLLPARSAGVAA